MVGDGGDCAVEFLDADREWLIVRLRAILQDAQCDLLAEKN